MSNSKWKLGKSGEKSAAAFLRRKGYKILDVNWQGANYELDIVAMDGDRIVFVEVKTRTGANYGAPQEAVSRTKRRHIASAAREYLKKKKKLENAVRFDVVAVSEKEKSLFDFFRKPDIRHIEAAFDLND